MGESFRDRIVWQRAIELTTAIYEFTGDFPREEMYALTNQLRRAAVSIPSNIAEGHGRNSDGQLLQFVCMARGSNYEVQTQLVIAERLGYGTDERRVLCQSLSVEVGKMLNATVTSLESRRAVN
ncbi:MAG TPA: four helix bundle protein [Acidobacteriaceae bacterium]